MKQVHLNANTIDLMLTNGEHNALNEAHRVLRLRFEEAGRKYDKATEEAVEWSLLGMLREGKTPEELLVAAHTMPLAKK